MKPLLPTGRIESPQELHPFAFNDFRAAPYGNHWYLAGLWGHAQVFETHYDDGGTWDDYDSYELYAIEERLVTPNEQFTHDPHATLTAFLYALKWSVKQRESALRHIDYFRAFHGSKPEDVLSRIQETAISGAISIWETSCVFWSSGSDEYIERSITKFNEAPHRWLYDPADPRFPADCYTDPIVEIYTDPEPVKPDAIDRMIERFGAHPHLPVGLLPTIGSEQDAGDQLPTRHELKA